MFKCKTDDQLCASQFGALGYIITLFIKKLRENLGGPSKCFVGADLPTPMLRTTAHAQ